MNVGLTSLKIGKWSQSCPFLSGWLSGFTAIQGALGIRHRPGLKVSTCPSRHRPKTENAETVS